MKKYLQLSCVYNQYLMFIKFSKNIFNLMVLYNIYITRKSLTYFLYNIDKKKENYFLMTNEKEKLTLNLM